MSTKAIENDQNDNIEKAQAVLLAARFLHYHGLEEEAVAMADKFKTFWEQLGIYFLILIIYFVN